MANIEETCPECGNVWLCREEFPDHVSITPSCVPCEKKEWEEKLQLSKERVNKNFYNAWNWLDNHPSALSGFIHYIYVNVVLVDPETGKYDIDDETKNTKVDVWLECFPEIWNEKTQSWENGYDFELDCGGDTYESWENGYDFKLDCGGDTYESWENGYDFKLDCGGDTYEQAILNLAEIVANKYPKYYNEYFPYLSEREVNNERV